MWLTLEKIDLTAYLVNVLFILPALHPLIMTYCDDEDGVNLRHIIHASDEGDQVNEMKFTARILPYVGHINSVRNLHLDFLTLLQMMI